MDGLDGLVAGCGGNIGPFLFARSPGHFGP